jgi:hypothetical protein
MIFPLRDCLSATMCVAVGMDDIPTEGLLSAICVAVGMDDIPTEGLFVCYNVCSCRYGSYFH